MMNRQRIASSRAQKLARAFPALVILGARQVGKSTLAGLAFPGFERIDLERAADYERLARDVEFVLGQHPRLIIDEAQRLPALFPALRSFLDRHPRHRVVLLGSASPHLVKQVSESLTGRLAILELGGMSVLEADAEKLWRLGGFPRLHWSRPKPEPQDWYAAYLRTTLEQDIPQLGFRMSSVRARNLLTMLAHAQGNTCNLSELGGSLGVDYHTVAHMIDVFEGTFLVRRLMPYHANVGKRLVKSPKVYVRDTGLLHSLLDIPFTRKALLAHPKAGPSFETFCIEQLITHARLADSGAQAFFYRTHDGHEIDLLLRVRGSLVPIEIKLGVTPPSPSRLERCMDQLSLRRGYVVAPVEERKALSKKVDVMPLSELIDVLRIRPS
jgi:uncharacterized protein